MNEPTIGRLQPTDGIPYFQVSREVAQSNDLTLEARGMHSLLLSLPANWNVRAQVLADRFGGGSGVRRVRKLLNELATAGLVLRHQSRDPGTGLMGEVIIFVRPSTELEWPAGATNTEPLDLEWPESPSVDNSQNPRSEPEGPNGPTVNNKTPGHDREAQTAPRSETDKTPGRNRKALNRATDEPPTVNGPTTYKRNNYIRDSYKTTRTRETEKRHYPTVEETAELVAAARTDRSSPETAKTAIADLKRLAGNQAGS